MEPLPLASEVLKDEHRTIRRVLDVLGRLLERAASGEGFERESLTLCVEFFQLFADACHHHKEETLLFPALEARGIPRQGGPIGVMLEEHRLGRSYVAAMAAALEAGNEDDFQEAARAYLGLLEGHIQKENNVLFVIGDRVLSGADQADLSARFCSTNCPMLTGHTHAQLESLAADLEARWPG